MDAIIYMHNTLIVLREKVAKTNRSQGGRKTVALCTIKVSPGDILF